MNTHPAGAVSVSLTSQTAIAGIFVKNRNSPYSDVESVSNKQHLFLITVFPF